MDDPKLCDTLGNFLWDCYEAKSVDLTVSGYSHVTPGTGGVQSSKAALDPDMHCSRVLPILLLLQPETLASLGGNKSEPSSGVSVPESAFEVYTSPLIGADKEIKGMAIQIFLSCLKTYFQCNIPNRWNKYSKGVDGRHAVLLQPKDLDNRKDTSWVV